MEQQLRYIAGRRKRAMTRLQDQLTAKLKPLKNNEVSDSGDKVQPLTDKDIKRIEKEIETLKSRI